MKGKNNLIELARRIAQSAKLDPTLKELDLREQPHFARKLEQANQTLRRVKLPKAVTEKIKSPAK